MVHCHRRHSSSTLSHLNRERERERDDQRIFVLVFCWQQSMLTNVRDFVIIRGAILITCVATHTIFTTALTI